MSGLQNQSGLSRNALLKGAVVAAGVVAGSVLNARPARAITPELKFSDIPGTGDVKVLNYALALEDLENALYQAALSRLTDSTANGGLGIVAADATYGTLVQYVTTFGVVENDHATFLRMAITAAGGTPIGRFTYNFGLATATAPQVLDLLLQAEATGVRAYLGAIPLLAVKSPYLQVAAAIQGTEARHTTALTIIKNTLPGATILPTAPLSTDRAGSTTDLHYNASGGYNAADPNEGVSGIDANLTPDEVLKAVSPFIVGPAPV